jgi:hypothetical protein
MELTFAKVVTHKDQRIIFVGATSKLFWFFDNEYGEYCLDRPNVLLLLLSKQYFR